MQVDKERWAQAQQGEILHHPEEAYVDFENNHYSYSWEVIFKILKVPHNDFEGKTIIDVGSGAVGPLLYCKNVSPDSTCIEPLIDRYTPIVRQRYEDYGLKIFGGAFEDFQFEKKVDEVWFFNILQHCMNPELCIEKAKSNSKIIRLFEPIDTAINNEHPHSFTEQWFKDRLGESVQFYTGGTVDRFHQANCVYGTIVL